MLDHFEAQLQLAWSGAHAAATAPGLPACLQREPVTCLTRLRKAAASRRSATFPGSARTPLEPAATRTAAALLPLAMAAAAAPAPGAARTLTLLHLNDCYDIHPRAEEPVGGAARMATKLHSYGGAGLVLFSGDAFNPSLLSTVTQARRAHARELLCGA